MTTATSDPRVGRPLTEVVTHAALRSAAIAANPHIATVAAPLQDVVTDHIFANVTVTSISFSPRKSMYQLTTRSPRGAHTIHLKACDVQPPSTT